MKVKASLHIHSNADVLEGRMIGYSVYDLIDRAKSAGIKVLAHTCHQNFVWEEAWRTYANKNDILLIPGVELAIEEGGSRNHIVAVNCDASINAVQTFSDLKSYRVSHPEMLLIAAHPNFGLGESLGMERLEQYWDLFDAVENSWFYTTNFNLNTKVQNYCQAKNKPYIATADLHNFNFFCLNTDYAILEIDELTVSAVVRAVRIGNFTNVSAPKEWWVLLRAGVYAVVMGWLNKLTIGRKAGKNT